MRIAPEAVRGYLEDAVAGPLEGFSGTDRTKVPGARTPERNRATFVNPSRQLSGPDLDLPAALRMLGPGPAMRTSARSVIVDGRYPSARTREPSGCSSDKMAKPMLVAEVHGRERAADVGVAPVTPPVPSPSHHA